METTYLYVDKIFNRGCTGLTDDPETIAYNNTMMGNKLVDIFTNSLSSGNRVSIVGYIGRFIFTADVSLDEKEYKMAFIDVEKNEETAKILASKLGSEDAKRKFMEAFYDQKKEYEKIYDSIKLIQGKPPRNK